MHIQKTTALTNRCRLRICHSLRQKKYVDWKHSVLFTPFCKEVKPPYVSNRRPTTPEYMFYTSYRDNFLSYHTAWYKRKDPGSRTTKIVPANIKQLLVSPIALAVWYLDDGTKRGGYNACRFATQSFSLEENELLSLCLKRDLWSSCNHIKMVSYCSKPGHVWSVLAEQGWEFLILQRHHLPIRRGRDTKHAL